MEHRDVGGVQHHNRLAIVASLFHEPARALEVRLARSPGARSVLAFADEVRAALPIVLCLADGGLQVALLREAAKVAPRRLLRKITAAGVSEPRQAAFRGVSPSPRSGYAAWVPAGLPLRRARVSKRNPASCQIHGGVVQRAP